jgi:hypothetical protein
VSGKAARANQSLSLSTASTSEYDLVDTVPLGLENAFVASRFRFNLTSYANPSRLNESAKGSSRSAQRRSPSDDDISHPEGF